MRNKQHIHEMLKAATNKRYLEDLIKEANLKVSKAKIEQDKKDVFIKAIPALRNYGFSHDATDEVLSYLEGICDGGYNLSSLHWIHDGAILMEHYEQFDGEEGEASLHKKNFHNTELKYSPNNPHRISELLNFHEGMKGIS